MSGPSCCNTPFDFAAAALSWSRSNVPTLGMSRSMINLRNAILLSLHSVDLPLRCTESIKPAADHDRFGALLGLAERAILVDGLQAAVRDEDVAVNQNCMRTPAGAEHQVGDRIDDRGPIRREH